MIMAYAGNDLDNYIYELTRKVRGIGRDVDKIVKEKQGYYFLGPLKRRLFNQGIDGSGKKIQPPYSEGYQKRKRKMGLRGSPVTLRLFGNWYNSMFVKSTNGAIEILTNSQAVDEPEKTDYLIGKYGEDILTLTVEEQEKAAKMITEELAKKFNDIKFPKIEFK